MIQAPADALDYMGTRLALAYQDDPIIELSDVDAIDLLRSIGFNTSAISAYFSKAKRTAVSLSASRNHHDLAVLFVARALFSGGRNAGPLS